jgi:pimeloyl-ACP methyl ester carboxylesterase
VGLGYCAGHLSEVVHVSDLISFIGKLSAGPVDLMGHSRGGYIAFRVAQQRSELVRRLILAEPGGELDASLAPAEQKAVVPSRSNRVVVAAEKIAAGSMDDALREFIDNLDGEGSWAASSAKQEYRDNARTLLGQINEQRQPISRDDAKSMSVPTLLIGGENTTGSFPVILRALASNMRDCRTAIIPEATHHMIKQQPDRTATVVLEFLASR